MQVDCCKARRASSACISEQARENRCVDQQAISNKQLLTGSARLSVTVISISKA